MRRTDTPTAKMTATGGLSSRVVLLCCVLLAGLGVFFAQSFAAVQTPQNPPLPLGDKYADLLPDQKILVDDWFRRFGEVVKKTVSPQEGYDNLPVSTKTTFSAVTHALISTPLTDQAGVSMGSSAITLIEKLDTVAGKKEGTRGDLQFRIYVVLKPNALVILARSREFGRGPDNVVYHHGFPISFRGRNGTPSLQISVTTDGKRADIDVDYRSSRFPVFLINGHLSASNSDVRVGDNDERHNGEWTGLSSWWRGFFGLPLFDRESDTEDWPANEPAVKAGAKPEIAIRDFLKSWLVDQKPEQATPYFGESAFHCRELEGGPQVDLGLAKFSLLIGLRQVNQRLGKVAQLSDVVEGVRLTGSRGKLIAQPYESEFVLYNVREDLAEQMKCDNRVDPSNMSAKTLKSKSFGKYLSSVFKFKVPGQSTESVAILWAKQGDYWKILAYDIEPESENYRVPDTTSAVAIAAASAPPLVYVAGDKDVIRNSGDFLKKWFVLGQPAEAFQYLSPRAYACANLYRDDNTPAPNSPEEAGQLVQTGMQQVAMITGTVKKLEQAIVAPNVSHPDVRLVKHSDSKAYVLASVPDHMAAAAGCQERKPGEELYFQEPGTGKVYGNFYATGFRIVKSIGDPSVLWALWTKEAGQWKIVSYFLLTP